MRSAINLSGLNLDVANAAARSGFDTINQAALHDLIWAVRCRLEATCCVGKSSSSTTFATHLPGSLRLSGAGDNTKRKRRGEDQTYIEVGTIASMPEQQRRQEGNIAPVAKKPKIWLASRWLWPNMEKTKGSAQFVILSSSETCTQ